MRSPATPPVITSLHTLLNEEIVHETESEVERLHSRWSSSFRVIVDRPPSEPLSRRKMSGRPSSVSVDESQQDVGVGDAHRRGYALERLRQSDSKWTVGSRRVSTDRPPLQPFRCSSRVIRGDVSQTTKVLALEGLQGNFSLIHLEPLVRGDQGCRIQIAKAVEVRVEDWCG